MLNSKRMLGSVVVFGAALCTITAIHATPTIEYSAGHADIGVAYEEGELYLHYHFGSDAVLDDVYQGAESEYDPSEIYTRVPDFQSIARPAGAQWDFLGTAAGNTVWYLPQSNEPGLPFLGTAAEELALGEWSGPIEYSFDVLEMPEGAEFSIWQTNFFGQPVVQVATSNGTPDLLNVPVGSHSHYNWGFTAEGVYQIELTATGTHVNDGEVVDIGVLWFAVGDDTVICSAECDGEPGLDLFDILCYLNLLNANDPEAECDGEPGLDLFDILCFLNAFNEGC